LSLFKNHLLNDLFVKIVDGSVNCLLLN